MQHVTFRTGFRLVIATTALLTMFNGCDGCSCGKKTVKADQPEQNVTPEDKGMPRTDEAEPPVDLVTMDSPLRELAEYSGLELAEIVRMKGAQKKFPEIARPAAFKDTKGIPVPENDPNNVRGSYTPEISASNLGDLPEFKLIIAPPFATPNKVSPKELRNAIKNLQRLLLKQKILVFSGPVVLINSPLESAESPMTMAVGLPVPADFEVPADFITQKFDPQRALFTDNMTLPSLGTIGKEAYEAFTSDALTGLIRLKCHISILVDLDAWPESKQAIYPTGDTWLYCK
jgi:hypothetical protein